MRNFEERKAEIFRRSEERIIEKRKKRSRIISICIPLLIFLGAYSIFILPAMMPAGESADSSHQEIADSIVFPETIEFFDSDGNLICTYTQAEKIGQICNIADSVINENLTEKESDDEAAAEDSYSLTFVYNTGNTITYTISGNTLFNTATQEYYTLTAEQKETLDLFIKE